MSLTDIVVLAALLFSAWSGWRRGFLLCILGPASLILCTLAAMLYFNRTHNLLISLAIGIVGPIILKFSGNLLLALRQKSKGEESGLSLINRCGGMLINFAWGSALVALTVFILAIMPLQFLKLTALQEDLGKSRSAAFLKEVLPMAWAQMLTPQDSSRGEAGPISAEELNAIPEYKNLMADERVKDLLSDPEVINLLKEKDFVKLLSNKKMSRVLEDPELIRKFIAMHKSMGGRVPVAIESAQ